MLALADEITGRLRRISQLESRMTRLTSDEAALRPWQALDIRSSSSTPAGGLHHRNAPAHGG